MFTLTGRQTVALKKEKHLNFEIYKHRTTSDLTSRNHLVNKF